MPLNDQVQRDHHAAKQHQTFSQAQVTIDQAGTGHQRDQHQPGNLPFGQGRLHRQRGNQGCQPKHQSDIDNVGANGIAHRNVGMPLNGRHQRDQNFRCRGADRYDGETDQHWGDTPVFGRGSSATDKPVSTPGQKDKANDDGR